MSNTKAPLQSNALEDMLVQDFAWPQRFEFSTPYQSNAVQRLTVLQCSSMDANELGGILSLGLMSRSKESNFSTLIFNIFCSVRDLNLGAAIDRF